MPEAKIGVIGGTGLYDIEGMTGIEEVDINTPFGKPSNRGLPSCPATAGDTASCPPSCR